MSYDFIFAGESLSDFWGVTTAKPPREIAEHDFELIKIPGRSKLEYIDNKRYENVNMTREIGLIRRPLNAPETIVEDIIEWLAYCKGYQEFEDTDHPGFVTYAVLTNFNEVQTLLRRYHKAKVKFSREPFWYKKDSLELSPLDLTAETVSKAFQNPFLVESKPILQFTLKNKSSGTDIIDFDITNGGVTKHYSYQFNRAAYTGNITVEIDCETGDFKLTRSSGTYYWNADTPSGFGENVSIFALTGNTKNNLNSFLIAPRWRCL